ncbi:serine/threonine-protein phosphatase 4 regulatory subunit 1-like isoform X2 [Hetaerina americana]
MLLQVPQIALLYNEFAGQLAEVVEEHLLPLVIKTLTDIEESVRKTAQTALITLMEQNLVTCEAIEEQVCPAVLMLADMGTLPDYHLNAVMLMSKIAPLVGREKAMELFLDHFVALCSDPAVFVRTVCAANFGDFCTLMGTEVTERVLLPCFVQLCKDSIWGVRKECANVFLTVSCAVTLATRKKVLAPIFVELLRDQSRWVKVAAFHSLGPFIWTFAPDSNGSQESHSPSIDPDTPRSSHPQNKLSHLRLKCGVSKLDDQLSTYRNDSDQCFPFKAWHVDKLREKNSGSSIEPSMQSDRNVIVASVLETKGCGENSRVEASEPENDYNTFLFWRLPLPDVGPNASIVDSPKLENNSISSVADSTASINVTSSLSSVSQNSTSHSTEDSSTVDREKMDVSRYSSGLKIQSPTNKTGGQKSLENTPENKDECSGENQLVQQQIDCTVESEVTFKEESARIDVEPKQGPLMTACAESRHTSDALGQTRKIPISGRTTFKQDIVPQALVDHFISMSTPMQLTDDDSGMAHQAHHCAFNFPAVALTLGRENWSLLRGAYEVLAVDVQWKVRRTLASSIHVLAEILGEELATRDLVPVFKGFAKDLDEVHMGVVEHIADFLKLIGPAGRNECLPYLEIYIRDEHRNWRFENELIRQLFQITNLLSTAEVIEYLAGLVVKLTFSKVAVVRNNATVLLAEHIRYLSVDQKLVGEFLARLAEKYATNVTWRGRQTYAYLCEQLLFPRSQREARADRDDDDDDCAERGQFANRDSIDEWIDERQEDMSWRTRIAPLLPQYVYPHLLDLSCDKVPNVRLVVAQVLGFLLATPAERSYSYLDMAGESEDGDPKRVSALHMALAKLQKDTDRDVRYFASQNYSSMAYGHRISVQAIDDMVDRLISPL